MANDPQQLRDHVVDLYEHVTHFIINQMHTKEGIRKHGQAAVDVLFKEFLQIDTTGIIKALRASELARKEKKSALRAINLIKEKRNGVFKRKDVCRRQATESFVHPRRSHLTNNIK